MKSLVLGACALLSVAVPALADEPDGLMLPPGFHAMVVAEGLTGARHIAVRGTDMLYVSTSAPRGGGAPLGIYALHLGTDGKADKVAHFGTIVGGTGIALYRDSLYASSTAAVYRYALTPNALTPAGEPAVVLDGMPTVGETNRILAFDKRGGLFVAVGAAVNVCTDPAVAKDSRPVGLTPCPSLNGRAGVWRFNAAKDGMKFPADGMQIVTGLRDMSAMTFAGDGTLYGIMHDRNGTSGLFPDLVSAADENNIAEEMHRLIKGADLGWPTTYYDGMRHIRLLAPEYGGDGKKQAAGGKFSTPVLAFTGHSAPLDMAFYNAKQFPKEYRGGAFVAMHGGLGPAVPGGHNGYDIVFVPFDHGGHPDGWTVFADGFAGPNAAAKLAATAAYRPVGLAVAADGGLYVTDSQKGKLWKISYDGK